MEGRRTYYHATYDDGDEEDFDYEELRYAVELQQSIALRNYKAVQVRYGSEPSDGEGSVHIPSDESDANDSDSLEPSTRKKRPRKRKAHDSLLKENATPKKKPRLPEKASAGVKVTQKMKHTSDSVLLEFSAETEYGQSFRTLDSSEQKTELARLNKGAVKGTKEAIKSKLITTKYKQLCADKMREFIIQQRPSVSSMFRAALPSRPLLLMSPTFMSVGEWVEVDADRTPGWNSEGGVGVIIAVHDTLADVKYVFLNCYYIVIPKYHLMTWLEMSALFKVYFDSLG
jgi:hypothetical protein